MNKLGRYLVWYHECYYPRPANRDFLGRTDDPNSLIDEAPREKHAIFVIYDIEEGRWEWLTVEVERVDEDGKEVLKLC